MTEEMIFFISSCLLHALVVASHGSDLHCYEIFVLQYIQTIFGIEITFFRSKRKLQIDCNIRKQGRGGEG